MLALFHQFAGHTFVGNGVEIVARAGNLAHADDLHRNGGAGVLQLVAVGVRHGADTAYGGAGDDDIALVQRAVLHQ
ncbi:hypothetical protein SDC9_45678 [bioreactor metagenome]|uniref:Uncharacterized protein n=1 Tax=bioreactor metagenome TaxID=1076179 RepID=A0A644W7K5_9ZZZZ